MIVNSLVLEEKDLDKNMVSELVVTLQRFLRSHGVSNVSIGKTRPEELKNALLRELD
jgi:hypothetical protein